MTVHHMKTTVRFFLAVLCAVCGTALPAAADIVFLSSGRTLSVQAHRFDGDSIVLSLRSGGEVTFHRSLVEKVAPDEVPYPDPADVDLLEADAEAEAAADVAAILDATPFGEIIAQVSAVHGVDPLLVRAVIQVESNYRPRARSPKGAMGLMQLMPATAQQYQVRNPYDPRANIEGGIKHLKGLIDRLGVELALAAYNAGEGAVKRFGGIPPYRETRNYVTRILALAGVH
jgi:soluble lytic murein transglycosylase-like protein